MGATSGIDLGLNIPLGDSNVHFSGLNGGGAASQDPTVAAKMADLRKNINDAANKGVKLIPFVPQLNLLRIGYLF